MVSTPEYRCLTLQCDIEPRRASSVWTISLLKMSSSVRSSGCPARPRWYVGGLLQLFLVLIDEHRWSGWPSFAVGIVMLHLGILVSGIKGGAHHRLLDRIFDPASEPTPP